MRKCFSTLLAAVFFATTMGLAAREVSWTSSFFSTNLDSEGSNLSGEWVFYLGYFEAGFVPSVSNTEQWSENWATVDLAPYSEASSRFVGFFESGGGDEVNQQAYIWGLNRQNITNEWILVSNPTWIFPGSGLGFRLNWGITSNDAIVVVGEVDQDGIHMRTAQVPGEPPLLTYAQWQKLHFTEAELTQGLVTGTTADADDDGRANSIEFALATDPKSGADLPCLTSSLGDDGRHEVRVQLARQTVATVNPQVTGNLASWNSSSSDVTVLSMTPTSMLFRDNTFSTQRFARVQVVIP